MTTVKVRYVFLFSTHVSDIGCLDKTVKDSPNMFCTHSYSTNEYFRPKMENYSWKKFAEEQYIRSSI